MISTAIKRAFAKGRQRGWGEIFLAVDIHDTIVKANYLKDTLPTDFFPLAKEVLQYLSGRGDVVLILYTCSHDSELVMYREFFGRWLINFKHANENPHILTTAKGLGNYEKKMYFDILLEDKAGFEPEKDWAEVLGAFTAEPLLRKPYIASEAEIAD